MNHPKIPRWDGIDRRKKDSDWLMSIINTLMILTLIIFVTGIFISENGRPETGKFHIAMLNLELRDYWIPELKNWFLGCLASCITLSGFNIIANRFRIKRKSDYIRLSPFFFFTISLVILVNITIF